MTVLTLHEMTCIKQDVKDTIDEFGESVRFYLQGESEIKRDDLGSIKSHGLKNKDAITMFAYPVSFAPTTQQLKKMGLTEECEIAISTAQMNWDNEGLTIEDIDIEKTIVIVQEKRYIIKEKSIKVVRNGVNAYLNFGLKRK